ncbi:MAG: DUF2334 domain-containing protein [Candidatus Aenigmarchaeota archaeon]|nr:DUF2334 domain-containing protein [Candidatus Aenigmarchaeota archaeon]
MQFVGGLSLAVHILIIIVFAVKKKLNIALGRFSSGPLKKILPLVIISCLFFIISTSSIAALNTTLNSRPNWELLETPEKCQEITPEISQRTVVLRIDDVQAFAWRNATITLLGDSLQRGIPLSVGLIPYAIESDAEMYRFLYENRCKIEICLHGWSLTSKAHSRYEIERQEIDKSANDLMRAKSKMEQLFGVEIVTFMPPENVYPEALESVIQNAGFSIISSEGSGYYDYTASTYNFQKNEIVSTQEIIELCEKAFYEGQPCIIMVHPQDYTTGGMLDKEKYKNYLQMLDELEKRGVSFARLKDLPEEALAGE